MSPIVTRHDKPHPTPACAGHIDRCTVAIAKALECFRAIDRASIARRSRVDRASRSRMWSNARARQRQRATRTRTTISSHAHQRVRVRGRGYKDIYTPPRTIASRASRRTTRTGRDSNDCTARDYTRRANRTGGVNLRRWAWLGRSRTCVCGEQWRRMGRNARRFIRMKRRG